MTEDCQTRNCFSTLIKWYVIDNIFCIIEHQAVCLRGWGLAGVILILHVFSPPPPLTFSIIASTGQYIPYTERLMTVASTGKTLYLPTTHNEMATHDSIRWFHFLLVTPIWKGLFASYFITTRQNTFVSFILSTHPPWVPHICVSESDRHWFR